MPMSRHSLMYFTTFAVLPVSDVSSADMNSIGVVRLQVRGDVGEIGVRRRVRLVEAVAGELLHQVEDLLDLLLRGSRVSSAPLMKRSRCFAISSGFFLPIARRSRSASPSE